MINICGLASKKMSTHIYYEKNFSKICVGWCPTVLYVPLSLVRTKVKIEELKSSILK
jgi:hypothetical protein